MRTTQNDIVLPNRYGDKNILKHIGGNKYKLVLEHTDMYCCVGYDDNGDVMYVDPSGGPSLVTLGKVYDRNSSDTYLIHSISKENIFELEKIHGKTESTDNKQK